MGKLGKVTVRRFSSLPNNDDDDDKGSVRGSKIDIFVPFHPFFTHTHLYSS